MLTFLRKIRRSLLARLKHSGGVESGGAVKYLIYAVGEIALVVIGILIALQINNWNEEAKQQETIRVYLINLVEDLKNDIAELENAQSYNGYKFHSLQHLLKLSGIKPLDLPRDFTILPFPENDQWNRPLPESKDTAFINLALTNSVRWDIPIPDKSTFNELNSTGILSYVKNQSLKDAISHYYEAWTWSLEEIDFQSPITGWEESLRSEGIVSYNITRLEDPTRFIRENAYKVTYLKEIIGDSSWIVHRTIFLLERAKELIALLEEEISKV